MIRRMGCALALGLSACAPAAALEPERPSMPVPAPAAAGLLPAVALRVPPLRYDAAPRAPTRSEDAAFRVSIPALPLTPALPRPLGVREFALENGLHVVVVARPSFPTVAARLFIASPPELDDDIAARRAHFLGGTFLRPLQGIPRTTAVCGDTACVVASHDLSDGLARALDRIADLVLVVAPDRAEYERRRTALRSLEGQASEALPNAVRAVMFGQGHRYGGPPLVGDGPSLAELEALRARAFVPSAATLVVVGDTTAQAVRAEVARRFAAWGPVVASAPRVPPAPPPLPEGPHVRFYANRSLRQLRAILAVRGPKPTDREAAAFVVLSKMLGGGMDSAVFHEVREELGAAYSVGEVIDWYPDASVLKLSASFDPQRAMEGLQGWINTMAATQLAKLAPDDVERAKAVILGDIRHAESTNDAMAARIGSALLLGRGVDYVDQWPRLIAAVSIANVRAVAVRYLALPNLRLVLVGKPEFMSGVQSLGLGEPAPVDVWGALKSPGAAKAGPKPAP